MPSEHLRGTLLAGEGGWERVLGGSSSQRATGMGGSQQITANPSKKPPRLGGIWAQGTVIWPGVQEQSGQGSANKAGHQALWDSDREETAERKGTEQEAI